MKIGNLVTYKQHPDNQVYPCPRSRMGVVTAYGFTQRESGVQIPRWKVYWYDSEQECWYEERDLEIAS